MNVLQPSPAPSSRLPLALRVASVGVSGVEEDPSSPVTAPKMGWQAGIDGNEVSGLKVWWSLLYSDGGGGGGGGVAVIAVAGANAAVGAGVVGVAGTAGAGAAPPPPLPASPAFAAGGGGDRHPQNRALCVSATLGLGLCQPRVVCRVGCFTRVPGAPGEALESESAAVCTTAGGVRRLCRS